MADRKKQKKSAKKSAKKSEKNEKTPPTLPVRARKALALAYFHSQTGEMPGEFPISDYDWAAANSMAEVLKREGWKLVRERERRQWFPSTPSISKSRIAATERSVTRMRSYIAKGLGQPVGDLVGLEASVLALAAEARELRERFRKSLTYLDRARVQLPSKSAIYNDIVTTLKMYGVGRRPGG